MKSFPQLKRVKPSQTVSNDFLSSNQDLSDDSSLQSTYAHQALVPRDGSLIHTIGDYYGRYMSNLDNFESLDGQTIKRSFDDYMRVVNSRFNDKIDQQNTNNLKEVFRRFDANMEELDRRFCAPDHQRVYPMKQELVLKRKPKDEFEELLIPEDLMFDFFHFYKIMLRLWLGERSRKTEIAELQPCKVLILRSLVKRKFAEEIDLR